MTAVAAVLLLAAMAAGCSSDGGERDTGSGTGSGSNDTTTSVAEADGEGSAGSFSSLTYNVAGLPQGINDDQFPEQNQPLISPLLNDYDVVVLQEDFGFYTDLLRADTTHEFQSDEHPGPEDLNPVNRESAAVGDGLNVLSRLPIGPLDRVPWQTCAPAAADCLALKGFARNDLQLAADDDATVIDLYNLHMEAGSEEGDNVARGDDLADLAAYLDEHSADRAVIIGGDWNLSFDEEPDGTQLREFLAETGLQDVCEVVDCGADDDVIDRFFFRSGGGVELTPISHAFERDVFDDADGGPLSDHDALAVEWEWTAGRSSG